MEENSSKMMIVPGVMDEGRALRPVDEDRLDGARTIFAHLKLNADRVEMNALDNTPTIRHLGQEAREGVESQISD